MPIPESKLETWSHQGAVTTSRDTYASVKRAVTSASSGYADKSVEVFLQGSYANDTNIRGDSDVDIVVMLDSIFRGHVAGLPPEQVRAYNQAYDTATYLFSQFKDAVVAQLRLVYGAQSAQTGHKSVKLPAGSGRLGADIVVCHQYRDYQRFRSIDDQQYDEGIFFPTAYASEVVNYPKQHRDNCTRKHQQTGEWFKPTVRVFKNIRGVLVDRGVLSKEKAPSYFIEGMLYNVPNDQFGNSYAATVLGCIGWVLKADWAAFVCANEKHSLLGPSSVQWSRENCLAFLKAVLELWKLG
jgi:hypothetical protein